MLYRTDGNKSLTASTNVSLTLATQEAVERKLEMRVDALEDTRGTESGQIHRGRKQNDGSQQEEGGASAFNGQSFSSAR